MGDFTRSECKQGFRLAQNKSNVSPANGPLTIPDDFPSSPSLYSVPNSSVLSADPSVFSILKPKKAEPKSIQHIYWQISPHGKRLVVVQRVVGKFGSQFVSYLLDKDIQTDEFLGNFSGTDNVSQQKFRPISSTPNPEQVFSEKTGGHVWLLDRGTVGWAIFSLDDDWTNMPCWIDFSRPFRAKPQDLASKKDQSDRKRLCWESAPGHRAIFCGLGLAESVRRDRVWAQFSELKSRNTISCNLKDCAALFDAFLSRNEVTFDDPLARGVSLENKDILDLLHGKINPNLGKHQIICGRVCGFDAMAAGPVAVFEIPSYKGSGLPALRMEFYGVVPKGSSKTQPGIRVVQIVDPESGIIAESNFEMDDGLVDTGFFRWKGQEYQYEISQPSGQRKFTIGIGISDKRPLSAVNNFIGLE